MKNGRISEQGSYGELLEKKGDFSDLVLQFLSEAYHEIDDKDELLVELKDKLPVELQSSDYLRSISSPSPTKIDQSMKSIESSKGVSSSAYLANSKKLERSNSNLSKSSIQLENDRKIEKRQRQESLKYQKNHGKLIETERMEVGSVKKKVYWEYVKALGIHWYLVTIISYTISHSFNVFSQLWLSKWSDDSINPENFNNTALRNRRLIGYAGFGIGGL